MYKIPERDWKKLRSMKDEKLQIACERIFEKITPVIEVRGGESHKAYLDLWKILNKEDKKLGVMFDDIKRSSAILKIAAWKQNGLLSEEEFCQFSEETQNKIEALLNL